MLLYICSVIDEAMEDGMWVVVSNCDQDEKFWTLISFKLYQLKLEAKVHQNYRLFIIINQASTGIIPGYETDINLGNLFYISFLAMCSSIVLWFVLSHHVPLKSMLTC